MGKHAFSGEYAPGNGLSRFKTETFSVGCYETGPKASGKGTKRIGAVKVRVRGNMADAELVYAKAQEVCHALDAGTYAGPKNIKV